MPFKEFWKAQTFTEDFYSTQSLSFWSYLPQFTPWRWVKSKIAIKITQNKGPISFQISMKTIITFCSIWAFFGNKWTQCQRSRGHILVWHCFFKNSLLGSRCWWNSYGRSSFKTRVFLALVSFFILPDNFFNLWSIFKCLTQRMERINWISRYRTLSWIFWKKIIKRNQMFKKLARPWKLLVGPSAVIQFLFGFCQIPDTSR